MTRSIQLSRKFYLVLQTRIGRHSCLPPSSSLRYLSLPRGTWLLEANEQKLLLGPDSSLTSCCFYAAIRQPNAEPPRKRETQSGSDVMPGVKDRAFWLLPIPCIPGHGNNLAFFPRSKRNESVLEAVLHTVVFFSCVENILQYLSELYLHKIVSNTILLSVFVIFTSSTTCLKKLNWWCWLTNVLLQIYERI